MSFDDVKKILGTIKNVNIFSMVKRFYGNLIDLIGFIVDKTSEQGADIAIRALPIVSPLPNAISMYYVSQDALGFNDWQAKAFAAAIELSLFGLFEVVLIMFDGYQRKPERYKYPLKIAMGIAIAIMLLIMIVVWWIETKSPVLAALPLFSAAGAAALALRRWHNHNEKAERVEIEDWIARFDEANHSRTIAEQAIAELSNRLTERDHSMDFLTVQIEGLTRQIEYMESIAKTATIGVSEPAEPAKTETVGSEKRRFDFLKILANTSKKSEVNFTEVGRMFGTSDTTMRKDLQWLIANEYWLNGNDWKPTKKGLTVVSEPVAN